MFSFGKKAKIRDQGRNNKVVLSGLKCKKRQNVSIKISGDNNEVIFEDMSKVAGDVKIYIYGDGCKVYVGKNVAISSMFEVVCGNSHPNFSKPENISFKIGEDTTIESVLMVGYNSNTSISIGKNCMLSYNVLIYNTDGHPIYDLQTSKISNKVKNLEIGDNVWLCMNSTILKNVKIADGCIVGFGAVVSKSFKDDNCVLAGNPAKIVKESVGWARSDVDYIRNEKDE